MENIVELPDSPRVGGKLMHWTSWIDDKDFRFAPGQIKLAAGGLKVAKTRTSKANRIVCALKAQRPAA